MEPNRKQTFEQIYRKHYLRLFRYALSWVGDEDVAKDMIADLFSDLWNHHTVLQPDTVDFYLGRAVKNRCVNYLTTPPPRALYNCMHASTRAKRLVWSANLASSNDCRARSTWR